jgi:hypothetical protein
MTHPSLTGDSKPSKAEETYVAHRNTEDIGASFRLSDIKKQHIRHYITINLVWPVLLNRSPIPVFFAANDSPSWAPLTYFFHSFRAIFCDLLPTIQPCHSERLWKLSPPLSRYGVWQLLSYVSGAPQVAMVFISDGTGDWETQVPP